jgi:hypothetical protein
VLTWSEFSDSQPELAAKGRAMITHFGLGLGYLATVRKDGGPRMHPFCPVFHERGLFGLILPTSPKCGDLYRDGRYAIHSYSLEDRDDEFYISGAVRERAELTHAVRAAFLAQVDTTTSSGDEACFEFLVERALLAEYPPRGEGPAWPPVYTKWAAP